VKVRTAGPTIALVIVASSAARGAEPPLVLERTIPLPKVAGRIDHLAIDEKRGRLLVAELGNGTVEAVDLATGKVAARVAGLREPQGLAWLPALDEVAVAAGGDGQVRFYRAADLAQIGDLALGDDADNLRVDPSSGDLIAGYGAGALAVIDPRAKRVLRTLPLPAHPESFQIEGARAIVNLPNAGALTVGDLATGRPLARWKAAHAFNFPMALVPASHAVAVVFRLPARLQLLDAATGRSLADAATCGDADDVFFDARRSRLYVSCGAGEVEVFGAANANLQSIGRVRTRAGARTSLFSPERDRLYVAARAPALGGDAAILVFRPEPER
jgi:hypothetical protein